MVCSPPLQQQHGLLAQPSLHHLSSIASRCITDGSLAHLPRLCGFARRIGMRDVRRARIAFDRLVSGNQSSWDSLIRSHIEHGDLGRAFVLYQKMGEEGLQPSRYVMVMLIKACTQHKDLERGVQLHFHVWKTELYRSDVFIGSSLVDMYAKCRSFRRAQEVFDDLPVRNVVTWNVMITAYTTSERVSDALHSFEQMQLEGISPNAVTYICALKACASVRAIAVGAWIHDQIQQKRLLENDSILGNSLVDMYAKCGCMTKAQEAFDDIVDRSSTSWNTLIGGYVKDECCDEALACFKLMKLEGTATDGLTFACALRACAGIGAIDEGRELHEEIKRTGMKDLNAIIGNALVDMYAKCGFLSEATDLFQEIPSRDIISWNTVIAGYAKYEYEEEVLNYFEQMKLEGIAPDIITFACSLKACGSIGLTEKGREIHAEIERKGLVDMVISNALVTMYSRCGLLAEAEEVFGNLQEQGIVSWNAMIAGYVSHNRSSDALHCLEQMQVEGVSPNTITLVCCLKACGNLRSGDEGTKVHVEVMRKGLLENSPVLGAALVDMYAKAGFLIEARGVFDSLSSKGLAAWNALISGYAECECGEFALACFDKMRADGVTPDAVTLACSLKACGHIGDMETGSEIHREIKKNGLLDRDIVVGNALLDMYAKCGSIAKACEVFEQLPLRNVVSWSTLIACYAKHDRAEDALQCFEEMKRKGVLPDAITFACSLKACTCIGALSKGIRIHGEIEKLGLLGRDSIVGNALVDMYAKCGRLHKAKELFLSLPSRDVVSWNALLAGYVKHERDEAVLASFEQMQAEGISPDSVTLAYVLKACGSMGAGGKGAQIHNDIDGKILAEQGLTIRNALMDMYAKCGLLRKARRMFDELSDPDIVSFNVLMAGHAQLGQCEDVFRSLITMEAVGMKPDSATFLSVLHSCNHGGLQLQAQLFFKAMIENYGLIPTVEHYTSMIDLFSRAGQLEKALAMLEKLPLHPDIVMWCTLLGSCKKWGDVWLAKLAFDNALSLDEKEASAYVSMFNIYANAHMHSDLHAEDNPWECDTLLKCK